MKEDIEHTQCVTCCECVDIVVCAQQKKLLPDVVAILKPCLCSICNKRFADSAGLKVHKDTIHELQSLPPLHSKTSLKSLSVDQLKRLLKEKGYSTSEKDTLLQRLKGIMSGQL